VFFITLFALPYQSRCQIPNLRALEIPHRFTLDFYKQSTTWNWLGMFSYQNRPSATVNWYVKERFQSNLLVPAEGSKKWKDEHFLDGLIFKNFSGFSSGLYFNSWYQSNKQISLNSQFANHRMGAFFQKSVFRYLQVTPYLGYQYAKNREHIDWGWDTGLRLQLNRFRFSNYSHDLRFSSDFDIYPTRQNREYDIVSHLGARFSRFSSDSLYLRWNDLSKQYYVADSIEQVTIHDRELTNKLFYDFDAFNRLLFQTRLQSRNISYFNGRDILLFENYIRYLHTGARWDFLFTFRTSSETQDNAGIYTDSKTLQSAFNTHLNYRFNRNHQLSLDAAYVKLQYDTPDSIVNNDDRDEQRFIFTLRYRWHISPLLTLDFLTYAYLFHQIYIYKERSMNNNWNRIYKLNPRLLYHWGPISNRLSTEVLANYTDYDFDYLTPDPRSFVFRKFTVSDSMLINYFAYQFVGGYFRLELEDKGSFFPKEFAQQVLQSYQSRFFTLFLRNAHFMYFVVDVGYTYYQRREWRHLPVKKLNRTLTNQGPYVEISYNLLPDILFSANTSFLHLDDSRQPARHYVTGKLKLTYYF
jgi:hypothetical protein